MTIKQRSARTYHAMRKHAWREQGGSEKISFGDSALKDGQPLDAVYLEPKQNLHFNDIWHCPDNASALNMVEDIAQYRDVNYIEMKGRWVRVRWDHSPSAQPFRLEGQANENRKRVTK